MDINYFINFEMMKIIDKYIIKKYLSTFFVMFGLFIPIGIMVDFAEKIDKFRENEVPANLILSCLLYTSDAADDQ